MILGEKLIAIELKNLDEVVLTFESGERLIVYARIQKASKDSQEYPVIRLLELDGS